MREGKGISNGRGRYNEADICQVGGEQWGLRVSRRQIMERWDRVCRLPRVRFGDCKGERYCEVLGAAICEGGELVGSGAWS